MSVVAASTLITPCVSDTNCTATLKEALAFAWSPKRHQTALTSYGGSGADFSSASQLLPSILFGILIYAVREYLKGPLIAIGRRWGVKGNRRTLKFQNQLWLGIFYTLSTIFGYYVLRDEPYFRFPLRGWAPDGSSASMWNAYPKKPSAMQLLYYNYEIGFYLTELTTLMVYCRRTDFLEYAAHHLYTLTLLIFSHLGYMHRIGCYILFIHDASDIMLCAAKNLSYCNTNERVTDLGFLGFIASFVYFRLYIFPSLLVTDFGVAPKLQPFTYNMWAMLYILHVLLQSLHVYWFALIVRVALRTIGLTRVRENDRRTKDVRSSSDSDEPAEPVQLAARHEVREKGNPMICSKKDG